MASRILIGVLALLWGTIPAFGANPDSETVPKSTRLVIYQQDMALVHQQFQATITRNKPEIHYSPVPNQILPQTVRLFSLTDPEHFYITYQQYRYKPLNTIALFDAYTNKTITVILGDGRILKGTLLKVEGNSIILKTTAGIQILGNLDKLQFQFPRLPTGLFDQPTLVWHVEGIQKSTHTLEMMYLTRGISWNAGYMAELDEAQKALRFFSQIEVQNHTNVTFPNARITLIAGQLHTVSGARSMPSQYKTMALSKEAAPPAFQTQPAFEYHEYALNRTITIPMQNNLQVPFITPSRVPFIKKYIFDARRDNRNVLVEVHFKNSKAKGLGMPLPAGVVRLFIRKKDGDVFIGEDRIAHTPRDENIKLRVGKAFDIVGERKEVSRTRISKNAVERTVEIELRNRKKKEAVTIEVREYASGEWEILQSNFPYRKENVNTIIFTLTVKPGTSETLKYRIREAW